MHDIIEIKLYVGWVDRHILCFMIVSNTEDALTSV